MRSGSITRCWRSSCGSAATSRRLGSPAPTIEGVLGLPGVIELGEPERDEGEIAARNAAVMASAEEMFGA